MGQSWVERVAWISSGNAVHTVLSEEVREVLHDRRLYSWVCRSATRLGRSFSSELLWHYGDDMFGRKRAGSWELHSVPFAGFLKQALVVNQAYGDKYQVQFGLETVSQRRGTWSGPDYIGKVSAFELSVLHLRGLPRRPV